MTLDVVADIPKLNRPVIEMFWVAEYKDGTALPQLDPINRVENSFGEVFHKKVKRFWWLPVSLEMTQMFPGTRFNPLLRRTCVELKGSKGFVARRTIVDIGLSGPDTLKPRQRVKCYVVGIEGGPRRELYPDGSVIDKEWPSSKGETQDALHHG